MQESNSGTLIIALIAIGVVLAIVLSTKTKDKTTQANEPQPKPQEASKMKRPTSRPFDPNTLSENDKMRYKRAEYLIEEAIKEKDWDYLEDQLNTTTQDFPDLIAKIKEALKNKAKS